jgi:lipopolysaccharide exporter
MTLMSGTTVAHIIPFAISPFISRIYSPHDFDVLALYLAIVSILAPVLSGTYDQASILPKEDEDAFRVAFLSFVISLIVSLAMIPAAIVLRGPISALLRNKEIADWLIFIPLSVFLVNLFNTLTALLSRFREYRIIATSNISQSISIGAVQLGLGQIGFGGAGLITGRITGQVIPVFILAWAIIKRKVKRGVFTIESLANVAKQYIDFPKYTFPRTFIVGLTSTLLIFLLNLYFAPGTTGSYSWMSKILGTPLSLIGLAIGKVFYQQATDMYNARKDIWPFIKKVLLILTTIAVVIILVMMPFGPFLFAFVFGEEWREAGRFAQIMAPWFLANFIFTPIAQTAVILDRQKSLFILMSGINLLVLAVFAVTSSITHDVNTSLIILSLTGFVLTIGLLIWNIRMVKTARIRLET